LMAPLVRFDLAASNRRYSERAAIFIAFRGPQAQANPLRSPSSVVSQFRATRELACSRQAFGSPLSHAGAWSRGARQCLAGQPSRKKGSRDPDGRPVALGSDVALRSGAPRFERWVRHSRTYSGAM
jgi:hypothetical protein